MVIYSRENAGIRREMQHNAEGVLRVWPKVDGVNVLVTAATCPLGPCVATDVEDGGDPVYSYVDVTFTPAALGENFPAEIDWENATTSGRETVAYDVVRTPLGLLVSLNQLRERRPAVATVLAQVGKLLAPPPATALSASATAGVYAGNARVELQDRLRQAARGLAVGRPALIIDRDRLVRAETCLTLAHVYEAIAKDPAAGTDDDSAQARHWRAAFEAAWGELGPLAIDTDGDGETDATTEDPTTAAIVTKRV